VFPFRDQSGSHYHKPTDQQTQTMPAITRSQTAFVANGLNELTELCRNYIATGGEWDVQMPVILNLAHRIGLRVDHDDHSPMGQIAIELHQWIQSQNPLAGARHLYPADVLNHIYFIAFRTYNPYTFQTYL